MIWNNYTQNYFISSGAEGDFSVFYLANKVDFKGRFLVCLNADNFIINNF